MKLILLSGGSGKRLWPLSNGVRSKQFLKVLSHKGEFESMVQRVWRQLENAGLQKDAIIATSHEQKNIIESQLGDVHTVIEPSRQDTFPAIALSCVYLYDQLGVSMDEDIIIAPVDPYVSEDYFETIKKLPKALENHEMALMGATPFEPSEKFGYILAESNNDFMEVTEFKEKPTKEVAESLIEQGAYWNCGVFCFKLSHIIEHLQLNGFSTSYKKLVENYSQLPKISFDYEVVEKLDSIALVKFDGDWKDLGTWDSITDELSSYAIGNASLEGDSINSYILNELNIPVIGLGLKDTIIAASPDGILVTSRAEADSVKKYLPDSSEKAMFEERVWGSFKILDYTKNGFLSVITKRVKVKQSQSISYQYHTKRTEIWTIISGEGEVVLDDKISYVSTGDTITISPFTKHSIRAISELEILEVQIGEVISNDDVIRLKYAGDNNAY